MAEETDTTGTDGRLAQAIEMEKALLGRILLDESEIAGAIGVLEPDDFYLPMHQRTYRTILEQRNAGEPVGYIEIYNRLGGEFAWDFFLGLHEMALPADVPYLARTIRNVAARRKAQAMLRTSVDALGQPTADLEMQYSQIAGDFVKLLDEGASTVTISDGITSALKELDKKTPPRLIRTGYPSLDQQIGAMAAGDYIIIAGRTSMGKSAFAANLCLNMAAATHSAAWCSIEGTTPGLVNRMLSIESGVSVNRLKMRDLLEQDYGRIVAAAGRLGSRSIRMLDGEARWPKLKAKIEFLKIVDPALEVVFIDYLGLVTSPGYRDRWQELSFVSADFKRLLVSLGLVGVMLSQINRQTENRKDHHPTLGDLRDTGALEQDADVILLLYRPSYYDRAQDPTKVEIGIAKNRDGATGATELCFDAPCVTFSEPQTITVGGDDKPLRPRAPEQGRLIPMRSRT